MDGVAIGWDEAPPSDHDTKFCPWPLDVNCVLGVLSCSVHPSQDVMEAGASGAVEIDPQAGGIGREGEVDQARPQAHG